MLATHRRRRLRAQPLIHLVPNIFTLMSLCAGLTAIRYGLDQRFELALILLVFMLMRDGGRGRRHDRRAHPCRDRDPQGHGEGPPSAEEQEATPEHAEAGAPEPPDAVIPSAPVVQAGHQIVEGAGRAHVSGSSPAGGAQAGRPKVARSPGLPRTAAGVVRGGHRGFLVSGSLCSNLLGRCQVFFSFFPSLCAHGWSGNDRDRCQVQTSASWAPWWVRWRARLPWSGAFPRRRRSGAEALPGADDGPCRPPRRPPCGEPLLAAVTDRATPIL